MLNRQNGPWKLDSDENKVLFALNLMGGWPLMNGQLN